MDGYDRRATISGLADLPRPTDSLVQRGFDLASVRQIMGGNFRRVFAQVLGIPQPS
jgi:microsomal dipeptidase-like Zn-dependent dipeptidase